MPFPYFPRPLLGRHFPTQSTLKATVRGTLLIGGVLMTTLGAARADTPDEQW